jgi:hypothetical protein
MIVIRWVVYCAVTLYLAAGIKCSGRIAATSGGGGIETVAIVGHVVLPDNSVPAQAVVYIRQTGFVSGAPGNLVSPDASVDAKGNFRIDSVEAGSYRIEVNDREHFAGIFNCDVAAGADVQDVGLDTMQPYAAISGSVVAPGFVAVPLFVQVYGMERFASVDSLGRFAFRDLPAGEYSLRIVANQADIGWRDTSNIHAGAGGTAVLSPVSVYTFTNEIYADWKYSKRISINTASSGANVSVNVTDFPFLVRLTAADFDFLQASGNGADIRFADENNGHLRYEIAQFDTKQPAAGIWVLLDTVVGNANTQFITMYWGRPDLTNWSSGAHVFAPSLGYAAVWHLDTPDDATGNGNALANSNALLTAGLCGNGYAFNGANSFLSALPSNSLNMSAKNLTVVVWEKATDHWASERMLFEHDVWPASGTFSFSMRNDSIVSFDFPSAQAEVRGWQGSNSGGTWHCLALTLNDAIDTGKVYRDGALLHADTVRSSIGSSTGASYIGSRGGVERFFKGSIDEVWVLSQDRPAEWLKLLYENMKENQTLYSVQ